MKDRVVGSLVGLAVGDALGTAVEFRTRDSFEPVVGLRGGGVFGLAPGEWTDDTSMALCLAESLIHSEGDIDLLDLLNRFADWRDRGYLSVNGRCFDIGYATSEGISAWQELGTVRNNIDSSMSGNGGIMRLAPAAMCAGGNAARAMDCAVLQSETTHASFDCVDSAEFLAVYLVNLYHGDYSRPYMDHWGENVKNIALRDYTRVARNQIRSTGYVIDTLEAAVWAVDNSNSFESAVLLAVNLGEDADSVGAVAGQIAGARWGYSAIPAEWLAGLAWHDRIVDLAEQLYTIGENHVAANHIS
jgi:ADP-ribosyl-[dinitrogen reductase] hydrolase